MVDLNGIAAVLTGAAALLGAVTTLRDRNCPAGDEPADPGGANAPAAASTRRRRVLRRLRSPWVTGSVSLVALVAFVLFAVAYCSSSPEPPPPARTYALTGVRPAELLLPAEVSLTAALTPASLPDGRTLWLLARGPDEQATALPCSLDGSQVRCATFQAAGPPGTRYRLTVVLADRAAAKRFDDEPRFGTALPEGTSRVWSREYTGR